MKFMNETRTNHHGYEYTVIGYNRETKRYTVHFTLNGVTKAVSKHSIQNNVVSETPAFAKPTKSLKQRTLVLFSAMQRRLKNRRAYADVKLDPRWKTLEGFRATIHLVDGYDFWLNSTGYALDHDTKGMNMYGPESCVFLSRSQNSSQPRKTFGRKQYPVGTWLESKHGQWYKIIGKDRNWSIIKFEETGEVRKVFTNTISDNEISKSVKGE